MKKYRLFFSFFFIFMGILFCVLGAGYIYFQYYRCKSFIPVQAIIESKSIERKVTHSQKGGTSVTYTPVIKFRYKVNGVGYVCDECWPISYSTSDYEYVKSTIEKFKIGQQVTAYRNPNKPSDAYLIKAYFFMPYFFTLLGMPFLVLGVLFLFTGKRVRPAKFVGAGWYQLFPTLSVADKFKFMLFLSIIWHLLGAGVLWHYFWYVPKPYSLTSYIACPIYECIGLVFVGYAIYFGILMQKALEPMLLSDKEKFKRAEPIKLEIRQKFKAILVVEKVLITAVCLKTAKVRRSTKTEYRQDKHYEDTITVLEKYPVRPAQPLIANTEITIPADKPASSPKGFKDYPRYEWLIELLVAIESAPDYKLTFPIVVE